MRPVTGTSISGSRIQMWFGSIVWKCGASVTTIGGAGRKIDRVNHTQAEMRA